MSSKLNKVTSARPLERIEYDFMLLERKLPVDDDEMKVVLRRLQNTAELTDDEKMKFLVMVNASENSLRRLQELQFLMDKGCLEIISKLIAYDGIKLHSSLWETVSDTIALNLFHSVDDPIQRKDGLILLCQILILTLI